MKDYEKYVSDLVARAKKAHEIANGYTQEKVDELTAAIAYITTRPEWAQEAAERLVEESGMGIVDHKIKKIYSKVKGSFRDMRDEKSVGLISVDEERQLYRYAKPMGVIGAIIPVTNGEATPIFKAMAAIKGRNAIILSPHPRAAKTNVFVADKIREVLKKYDAPEDLVLAIDPEYVSIETSAELMKQVDFVVATGGTPMVRAAYSSGTPTIGVGTGNVVTIVDGSTDLDEVAGLIVASKTFDNATSCSTENNIIVFEDAYDDFVAAMARKGGHVVKDGSEDKDKLVKTMWPNTPNDNILNRAIVAQPAPEVAKIAGIEVPEGTVMILVEENAGFGVEFPLTGEKLSPVAELRKAKDLEDALQQAEGILDYQGLGHSCGIHTSDKDSADKVADRIKVSKVVVNLPQSLSNSGSWTCGYPMSMTLGCGTWGYNSVSHSVNWKDMLNFTEMAFPIDSTEPTDEDLFQGKTY